MILFWLAATALATATPATAQSPGAPTPPPDSIVLAITGEVHGPLRYAHLQPLDARRRAVGAAMRTDATGHARTARPAPGTRLRLVVRSIGFVTDTVDLAAAAVRDTVRVTLARSVVRLRDVCTMDVRPALLVRLAGPVLHDTVPVRIVVRDGAYVDTATVDGARQRDEPVGLADERAGRYRIAVAASGYSRWERRDVRVLHQPVDCHVGTREITVTLVPLRPQR